MRTYTQSLLRATALTVILGTLAFATPSFSAGLSATDESLSDGPPSTTWNVESSESAKGSSKQHMRKPLTAEERRQRVEERIKNLHTRLKITKEQESAWGDVAQAMRDSEANVSALIEQRRANAEAMNAVDDLQSYQKIAQAHSDGLKKVSASFSDLYDDMSAEQKQNADKVFGSFEGHRMKHMGAGYKPAKKESN